MSKKVIPFIFLILCLFSIFSQENNCPNQLTFKNIPKGKDYLVTKFYPYGWSKDGKLAYCISYPNEAMSEGNIYNFIIQDLVSDEIVYDSGSIDIIEETQKNGEENEEPLLEEDELSYIWYGHIDVFNKAIQKFGIVQTKFIETVFPLKTKDDIFSSSIDKTISESDEGFKVVSSYSLIISSQKKGKKTIVKKNDTNYLSISLIGYLKSPYENRIAVMGSFTSRGYEGPPNPVVLKLFGCNLDKGFK